MTKSEILQHQYRNRFEQNQEYRNSVWEILCRDFFSCYIKRDSVLLDLGAGWGEFSRNIQARTKYAMDLNRECGSRVEGYSTFIQQDCSEPWPLSDDSLDVVFTSNFLEHLPDKAAIEATIREACRCLKRNGIMVCLGPNIRFLPGDYWDFWDHYVPIGDGSLAELLKLSGFSIQEQIARFLPFTMSAGYNPPLVFLKLYLRMPVVWPLFGKQFLVVARKE